MRNLNLKMKFIKLKKNNKKKGFTLIELVAVLAIIAVLSATFVPKFSNYITEAKKVAVLNEAKSVVTAYESVSYKLGKSEEDTNISALKDTGMPLEKIDIEKIPVGVTVAECKILLNTNTKFTITDAGILNTINGKSPITIN